MLALTALLFILLFIITYPLTIQVQYQNHNVSLAWLPRLCGSYAAPHTLIIAKKKPRASEKKHGTMTPASWYQLARKTLPVISLDYLKLDLTIGAADPFASSMLAGAFLSAVGSLRGVIAESIRHFPSQPDIRVRADWRGGGIQTTLDCIFHIHCGDIIRILFYAVIYMWKGRHAHGKRT